MRCCTCKTDKDDSEFYPSAVLHGKVARCKPCSRDYNKMRRERPGYKSGRSCLECGVDISTRNSTAKYCSVVCGNASRNATPGRKIAMRVNNLRHKYGIEFDQFQELLSAQDCKCAICGSDAATCVDHDHSTGAVRGVLCQPCNKGLGNFRDTPNFLRAAAAYLEERM